MAIAHTEQAIKNLIHLLTGSIPFFIHCFQPVMEPARS